MAGSSDRASVIEVSYEVANKVGGIYTVLASKAEHMVRNIKDYYAIGPYYEKKAAVEFEESRPPQRMKKCFDGLKKKHGIKCRFGRWLVDKKPRCILIEPGRLREKVNDIKAKMWEDFKVDSLHSDWWYDEPLPWSWATGIVIEGLRKERVFRGRVIAHFHEWLTGPGLLYLKSQNSPVRTVFTTHATVLGRTIAEVEREDLYDILRECESSGRPLDDKKAYEYNCQSKHLLEKATAHNTDVFTTVSETMSPECEYVLGRRPDVVLPNGLNMDRFPLMEDLSNLHIQYREWIRRFLMSYFSPYYEIDVKNTLLFFISGRFEFHNKGIDVFIDALGRLNKRLKESKSAKKTVVAFIWVPHETKERKRTVMENLALFERVESVVEKEGKEIEERIIDAFAKGEMPTKARVFDKKFLDDLKRMELELKSKHDEIPPITPFDLYSENAITEALKRNGLANRKDDRVKVIYYPAYLSPTDGLLGMNYYDAIIGCHMGVFPSYYEPWGYTPLETAALGLQSVTTDLSGFGKFIEPRLRRGEMSIMVLKRKNRKYEECVNELEGILYRVYRMTKKSRGANKIRAKQLSLLADWKLLVKNYLRAYDMALK